MANEQSVIPPVVIEEFTCAGNGLLYEEHPRESPADLRLLVLSQGDKNGISDRDRKVYTTPCIFLSIDIFLSYALTVLQHVSVTICRRLPSTCGSWSRPKTWWLAQNKFYGLANVKATPINILRSKLEDALRTPNGMIIPERILNLEAEGSRKYKELSQTVLQETQAAKKGRSKLAKGTNQTSGPKQNVAASSSKGKGPTKPVAGRNAATGSAPLKRGRSPDDSNERISNKRMQPDENGPFGFLSGMYDLTAPHIREEWDFIKDDFRLSITLDSEKRIYGAFYIGICSGLLRSTTDIQTRADGANAKFEWCGREENAESTTFPHEPGQTGELRFTKRKRDGRHTIKGFINDFPAVGRLEFTGERTGIAVGIAEDWDIYDQQLEGGVRRNSRWVPVIWSALGIDDGY